MNSKKIQPTKNPRQTKRSKTQSTKSTKGQSTQKSTLAKLGLAVLVVTVSAAVVWRIHLDHSKIVNTPAEATETPAMLNFRIEFRTLVKNIGEFEDQQNSRHLKIVDQATIQNEISAINVDLAESNLVKARQDETKLKQDLAGWQSKLLGQAVKPVATVNQSNLVTAPILLYHNTPTDFDSQLSYLQAHDYTAITLSQLASALTNHGKLPAKPVVITFDDGYSDQLTAFHLLEKHNMRATFFIIIVRADSGCGPSQSTNCNPDYLSWGEIEQLDATGLITIGDHTVDHPNLASLSFNDQQAEIESAKQTLEQKLGHSIKDFAYPYGSFNTITIKLVKSDGFVDAVSTTPGLLQSKDYLFSLHRVRSAYGLP